MAAMVVAVAAMPCPPPAKNRQRNSRPWLKPHKTSCGIDSSRGCVIWPASTTLSACCVWGRCRPSLRATSCAPTLTSMVTPSQPPSAAWWVTLMCTEVMPTMRQRVIRLRVRCATRLEAPSAAPCRWVACRSLVVAVVVTSAAAAAAALTQTGVDGSSVGHSLRTAQRVGHGCLDAQGRRHQHPPRRAAAVAAAAAAAAAATGSGEWCTDARGRCCRHHPIRPPRRRLLTPRGA